MRNAMQFLSDLSSTTILIAALCSQLSCSDQDAFSACTQQFRVLHLNEARAKECAGILCIEAARAASEAETDGNIAGMRVAAVTRLIAFVWLDVAELGWNNLLPADECLHKAMDELQACEAALAREMR